MLRIVIILLLCNNHAITQPVSSSGEARQTECCPCPQPRYEDAVTAGSERAASRLEHCPCWPGSPDSDGASSLFFPTVRAAGPLVRPSDSKEDAKNLLEPEVTLASSMLDTLREATEKEYQDALARDSARAADSDAVPEESARNVVIIVHPKDTENSDNFLSEASHVEPRCIHPLGSSLGKLTPVISPRLATSKHPGLLHHNLLHSDSSLGASDVQESVIDINGNTLGQEHKPLSRFSSPLRDILNTAANDGIMKDKSLFSRKADEIKGLEFPDNLPKLNLNGLLRKPFVDKTFKNNVNLLPNSNRPENTNDIGNLFRQNDSPLNLKNLLKLRDVELIPKLKHNKTKLSVPTFSPKSSGRDSDGSGSIIRTNECVVAQDFPKTNFDNLESPSTIQNLETGNDDKILSDHPELNKSFQENIPGSDFIETEQLITPQDTDFNDELSTRNSDAAESSSNLAPTLMLPSKREEEDVTDIPFLNQENNKVVKELTNEFPCEPATINRSAVKYNPTAENSETSLDKLSNAKPSTSVKSTLSDIQKDLMRGIESLRKASKIVLPINSPKNEQGLRNNEQQSDIDNQKAEDTDFTSRSEEEDQKPSEISIGDLQEMSDSLLISNNERSDIVDDINCINVDKDSSFESGPNNVITLSTDEAPVDSSEHNINEESLTADIEENSCIDNSKQASSLEMAEKSAKQENKEMDTGASDTVITKMLNPLKSNLGLRSPIDDSNIMKPLVSDPLKLLDRPLHQTLNTNVPTLDNLQERIANAFKPLELIIEQPINMLRSTDENFLNEPMTAASIANPRQKLPVLKPLDNLNLDIFQNKLPHSIDTTKKSRLNAFRASDLKDVELLPRNLVSTRKLTNDGGLLDFGSGRTSSLKSINSKPMKILGDHLEALPSLDDLSNTMRSNTKNLLNMPVHPDLNLFTENLRSANEDITENLKQNAQQTMKELQQKIKFALRKSNPKLAEPLAKPQELFEDVNDKLKAIHYDLNDRLDSLRNDILESTRLKKFESESAKSAKTNFSPKPRKPPARLQSAASSISAQNMDPHVHNIDDTESHVPNFWQQPLRRQSAVSTSPTIASKAKIDNPTLPHLQRESLFTQNPPLIPPKERLLTTLSTPRPIEFPSIRKAVNPLQGHRFKPNKVTISFGSTTPRPIPTLRSRIPNKSIDSSEFTSNLPFRKSLKESAPRMSDKLSPTFDPQLKMPSEFNSFRTPAPSLLSDEDDNFDYSPFNNNFMKNSNLQSVPFRERYHPQNSFARSSQPLNDNSREILSNPLKQPKTGDNSFLSKVMNAFSTDSIENKDNVRPDMSRSESRDVKAVQDGSLKENVTYRCRMVCTKE